MIKKSYISQLLEVNKKNITNFEFLPNRRKIRPAQVKRIYKILKEGKHFEAPIVVNEIKNKMRILDGAHRVTAMEMFLNEFPDKSIEVNMATYRDLTPEEEMDVFQIWNKGIKQSPDDYLNLRKDEMPIYNSLQNSFPCKVPIYSPQGDGIKFKTLIGAYLGAIHFNSPNAYDSHMDTFIDKTAELGGKDHKFLTRFMEGFITSFGVPSNNNQFSSYVPFIAIMRIYYDNFYTQGETYFWNKMKSNVFPSATIRQHSLSGHARLMIPPCVGEMLRLLNKGKRTNLFELKEKIKEGKK